MVRSTFAYILPIFVSIVLSTSNLNYSQCALIANETFWQDPNDTTFLRDQNGKSTGNLSQAWGISYYDCKRLCETQANSQRYDWRLLTESLGSWLIPWLALTAQLPYESKDTTTNFMALFLALGSPSHITFSLFLTILNARSINRVFRQIKERNEPLNRPLQIKAIKAARTFLVESQQTPIQIFNGPRREFAQLVVCPENWTWWNSVREEIVKTKRSWTYSLYAQLFWVSVAQLLAIVDFFTSSSFNNSIGIGLAINSLWTWMLPVVVGWVFIGTQNAVGSTKAALSNVSVPLLGEKRELRGGCIGIRDRTTFYAFYPQQTGDENRISEQREEGSRNQFLVPNNGSYSIPESSRSSDVELEALSTKIQVDTSARDDIEQLSHPFIERRNFAPSHNTFVGFSIPGHELEPGAIFNYARAWTHMNAVKHVAEAFMIFTERQKAEQTVNSQLWNSDQGQWDENLKGSPEDCSRYISPIYQDEPDFSVHAEGSSELVLNCITAAFLTGFLQWGSAGAAITIAYK